MSLIKLEKARKEHTMKKLLITGFEPFGGEIINPSWEAVKTLPSEINDYALTKLLIPVTFSKAAEKIINTARDLHPDAVLCIGQAGGRCAITPELVAINLRHASIPDNDGNKPKDEPIIQGEAAAFFSTLPMRKISEAIQSAGIPSYLSYSAGAYVCNDVIYTLLSHFQNTKTRAGFIHVPYCKEQNKEPALDLSTIVQGLTIAIETLDA